MNSEILLSGGKRITWSVGRSNVFRRRRRRQWYQSEKDRPANRGRERNGRRPSRELCAAIRRGERAGVAAGVGARASKAVGLAVRYAGSCGDGGREGARAKTPAGRRRMTSLPCGRRRRSHPTTRARNGTERKKKKERKSDRRRARTRQTLTATPSHTGSR